MSATYRVHERAQADLEEIWLYSVEQWGVEQADRYIENLVSRFEWLAAHPLLGKARDDIKAGYFCYPEGRHLIFYVLHDEEVEIIGVLHQRMDIIEHF